MPKVLIAVDETMGSRSVLSIYRTMAQEPETVVLIHVRQPAVRSLMHTMPVDPELRSSRRDEAGDERSERIISFYEKELEMSAPRVRIRTLLREGVPSEEILKAAREEHVDLIVMGSAGKSLFKRFAASSTTKQVEQGAAAPVLVAREVRYNKSNECRWKERKTYAA